MTVNKETVRHIARLARIRIDEAEEETLAKDLGGILQWIDALQAPDRMALFYSVPKVVE